MNRYPVWKYLVMAITLVFGLLYTLPNFFGEAPAVQVSSGKATVKVDTGTLAEVERLVREAKLTPTGIYQDANSVKVRFATTDEQLKAKDALAAARSFHEGD